MKLNQEPEQPATCRHCGRELLFGRSDRKFCNDTCRNTYNRELRKRNEPGESLPEQIIQILKRNYALMLKFNPSQNEEVLIDRLKLHQAGFAYNYFTGCDSPEAGVIRYHCFDQCWTELEYGLVKLGTIELMGI